MSLNGCREHLEDTVNPAQSPQISGLQIVPEVVCGSSEISFMVTDPNGDRINWEAKMNTAEHGALDQTSGNETSGTMVLIRFKAATSGTHRHRVTATVTARDDGGSEAEPAKIDFFVFSRC